MNHRKPVVKHENEFLKKKENVQNDIYENVVRQKSIVKENNYSICLNLKSTISLSILLDKRGTSITL